MKPRLIEHFLSIVFVTAILLGALVFVNRIDSSRIQSSKKAATTSIANQIDVNDPVQTAILNDVLNIYYPGQYDKNRNDVAKLIKEKEKRLEERLQEGAVREQFSFSWLVRICGMFVRFLLVYGVVMLLTYYGVQTIAVWRFCRKHRIGPPNPSLPAKAKSLLKSLGIGIATFVLFCPAYVIAYSMRTGINTDTIFFMALLGVASNGLLVVYANKFFAFLTSESRKGYVDTARVKNLHYAYGSHDAGGISWRSILRPVKKFDGHIFGHIFQNAQLQYLSTVKEQASFLITGLIIIEMALNIHGHLSYEMLRQMLYKNYGIVLMMILCIFYAVKLTEIVADVVAWQAAQKFENKI